MGILDILRRVPRRLCVVICDDERDTVLTLTALLAAEGHRVTGTYTARDVIAEARRTRPDAVIVDIAMPRMSGHSVARELRRVYGSEAPLLIAMSGIYVSATDRMLSQRAGFDHYLQKPFDPNKLLALLKPLTRRAPQPSVNLSDSTYVPPDGPTTESRAS
jgi:DNA-binding response OmpR family regulator